ncbi:hypothetical protein AMTR_s00142p00093640 [Amborella trichopoda]|uniref:Tify domain-containing protein n=1 Tax=Amborella trichopoda TaxID=13333 RepID=W1PED9_AMBTC|nr:hypothetical protein AMTR_s00142p00093640 [Amborella trichopoda]
MVTDKEPVYSPVALRDYLFLFKSDISDGQKIKIDKLMAPKVMAHLLAVGWSLSYIWKNSRGSSAREKERRHHLARATDRQGGKFFKAFNVSRKNKNQSGLCRELRNLLGTPKKQSIRTVFSWMIDHNVILPREKLSCFVGGEDSCVKGEARVTSVGIKCNCCSEVYNIADFEAHVRTPSTKIFVEDGRSFYNCQRKMLDQSVLKDLRLKSCERKKACYNQCKSDAICSICHYGGDLVLCERCPSAYHLACLHLKDYCRTYNYDQVVVVIHIILEPYDKKILGT